MGRARPPGLPECRGSNRLIADGAGCLWDIPEFVDSVAPRLVDTMPTDAARLNISVPAGLPEGEAAALAGVGLEPTAVDAVAGRSGMRMQDLLSALALLELKGYVSRDGSGAFVRRAGG